MAINSCYNFRLAMPRGSMRSSMPLNRRCSLGTCATTATTHAAESCDRRRGAESRRPSAQSLYFTHRELRPTLTHQGRPASADPTKRKVYDHRGSVLSHSRLASSSPPVMPSSLSGRCPDLGSGDHVEFPSANLCGVAINYSHPATAHSHSGVAHSHHRGKT